MILFWLLLGMLAVMFVYPRQFFAVVMYFVVFWLGYEFFSSFTGVPFWAWLFIIPAGVVLAVFVFSFVGALVLMVNLEREKKNKENKK